VCTILKRVLWPYVTDIYLILTEIRYFKGQVSAEAHPLHCILSHVTGNTEPYKYYTAQMYAPFRVFSHTRKLNNWAYIFFMAQQPRGGPRSHIQGLTITFRHTHILGRIPLMTEKPCAQTSIWQHTTLARDKTSMHPAGFEPAISAGVRPQKYALDRASPYIGNWAYTPT
jgi:hypothetical protein